MTTRPEGDAPRIVRPRKPSSTWRPVIAIGHGEVILERTGETYSTDDLPAIIAREPSSIIACQGFGGHLVRLGLVHGDNPRFNYRLTPRWWDNRRSNTRVYDAVVNFVGFKGDKNKKNARYHYPLDPVHFVRTSIDELRPENIHEARAWKLLEWAKEVRDWCHIQEITPKPSSGGLIAQLLRDPRFYPQPRRKCPRLINDISRSQLPGNYYHLLAEPRRTYQAIYLDLTSAHHLIAAGIRFPDVNSLHAFGRWSPSVPSEVESEHSVPCFADGDSPILHRPGLFRLRLNVPHIPDTLFPPPWAQRPGLVDSWVYSNELELVKPLGIHIEGVICALTSRTAEEGLNLYAKFALQQIRENPALKPWLKPTLHSTYGVLAARPQPFETGYYRAKGGTPTEYHMGNVTLAVKARRSPREVESRLANVIHRGMIEAGVRKEALRMAAYLHEVERREVLAIYADSVFIRDNREAPRLLPPGWRIASYCTDLRFHDATHFVCREMIRLPGLARHARDAKRIEALLERDALIYSAHKPLSPQRRR